MTLNAVSREKQYNLYSYNTAAMEIHSRKKKCQRHLMTNDFLDCVKDHFLRRRSSDFDQN